MESHKITVIVQDLCLSLLDVLAIVRLDDGGKHNVVIDCRMSVLDDYTTEHCYVLRTDAHHSRKIIRESNLSASETWSILLDARDSLMIALTNTPDRDPYDGPVPMGRFSDTFYKNVNRIKAEIVETRETSKLSTEVRDTMAFVLQELRDVCDRHAALQNA